MKEIITGLLVFTVMNMLFISYGIKQVALKITSVNKEISCNRDQGVLIYDSHNPDLYSDYRAYDLTQFKD